MNQLTMSSTVVGGQADVVVSGEVDIVTVDKVVELAMIHLTAAAVQRLVFDLQSVSFIDSSGIGGLIKLGAEAKSLGKQFALRQPSERVLRVLELTGLAGEFTVVPEGAQPP
jgi:anti-sigma B factor antagonist